MKRDWFNRGVRMQHQFGGIEEKNGPLSEGYTWEPPDFPFPIKRLSGTGKPCEIKEFGLQSYRPDPSPICKPDHSYAETQGPARFPDLAEQAARPVPVGTKKRSQSGQAWGPAQPDSSDFGYTKKP
ncbi:MAG: hypothetical protein HRJ53_08870 [Acidobacteria bacterium Pan2503]|uniref:Uncharacterized protein n=1 Tax=Candidatus Acidiferrum panamense TaxID=2741543 RepID=A0A7V8SWA4_9BACT|nr:hypothetical protein [Candidatus Acidoferrum panamensis]